MTPFARTSDTNPGSSFSLRALTPFPECSPAGPEVHNRVCDGGLFRRGELREHREY